MIQLKVNGVDRSFGGAPEMRLLWYFYDSMRQAGGTARFMLVQAASQRWGVSPSDCRTESHSVVHPATGRRLGYGELAGAASKLAVPKKEELQFKNKDGWRYIGQGMGGADFSDMCTGKAIYGMDVRGEGMLYASIEHPPVLGGKVKSYDDKAPGHCRPPQLPDLCGERGRG